MPELISMHLRSLLFVPGDQPAKLARAPERGADALILDLEDSVAPAAKDKARREVAAFLKSLGAGPRRPYVVVRVNGLETGLADDDLNAVCQGKPDAIMLPKAMGGSSIIHLDAKLAVREAESNLNEGSIKVIALATEMAKAVFDASSYAGSSARLKGLAWGVEDLSVDIGGQVTRDHRGYFLGPYAFARNVCLLAAAAAKVQAIDTVMMDFRDLEAMRRECRDAWRDGFTGKLAIHPDQVAIINETFMPSSDDISHARAVIAAFEANPGAGTLSIDGRLYDAPHLARAKRTIALAGN